ncbi:Sushi, von Willebrand factor type A, EGF and pentraxin domain-containing protein 1 [Holothuria leucospilota]|uniref:Sushi, von Willebrand factor type A, EGF and pentraxin domain-containing protein 1 n=1 Tax=Holothuria leucospilota TaxID=206669 RepID=A0A9Q1C7V4_HOLLE|nr:Sushi, von Willebrand factor type A, EGF and pentraxin domain-containing protein 1 [Holothuria leucospilota]
MVPAGVTTRSVFWTPPTATDSSGYTVSASHTPGSQFGVGTTPVTYTFTDSARNQERCTFFVNVQQGNHYLVNFFKRENVLHTVAMLLLSLRIVMIVWNIT